MAYATFSSLVAAAREQNSTLAQAVLAKEALEQERSLKDIRDQLSSYVHIMRKSITDGLDKDIQSRSGLTGGDAYKVMTGGENSALLGGLFSQVLAASLAVAQTNACMGRIIAAPTAGASGVLPGVLITVADAKGFDEDAIIDALLVASGIGACYAAKATLSGAAGGCQAEIGTGASMAAGALADLLGGDFEQVGHAASLAMQGLLGLVCDPVAGLVEIPCIMRNASGASIALGAAEMALSGVEFPIPLDEVIATAARVGAALPIALRETARGGLAITPTALKMAQSVKFVGSETKECSN